MFVRPTIQSKRHDSDIYPMIRNLNADPRLLGSETQLVPFCQFISSQRLGMFSSNSNQCMITDGCEMPHISSGMEREFKEYTFNHGVFEMDAQIIDAIPKYRTGIGSQPIKASPTFTLIYLGEDNLIHCMEVPTYVKGTDGFGYDMHINYRYLNSGVLVPKGTRICHSNAIQGSKYCLGLNANICFMTDSRTVEDAFCISKSLAKRLESTAIRTLQLQIDKNMIPLNLYGSVDEYKFMPDIHESVREDGIVCAFRRVNDVTIMTDMADKVLMEPQHGHDDVYYADSPDSTIIDIDVFRNNSNKIKTPAHIFEQISKYEQSTINFYTRIIDVYNKKCLQEHYDLAPEFNTLVTRAASILDAYRKRVFNLTRKTPPKFARKGDIIEFVDLVITYRYKNKVTEGNKITGREGGKGVISSIEEDADMPVNDFGVRADMIQAPESVFNRMNMSQLYEQYLNCLSYTVLQNMKNMPVLDAYEYLIEYFYDVNPCYGEQVDKCVCTSKVKKEALVKRSLATETIILVCPSYLDTLNVEWAVKMEKKYGIRATPVEYNMRDSEGKLIRRVRTLRNIWIGKKYIYILCKIPHARSCSQTYVNQWETPLRIKSAKFKSQYPVGLTPIRVGEDENRNMVMMIGARMAFRILSLYANAPEATNKLTETLLTEEYPTRLTWVDVTDEQLRKSNQMIKVYKHIATTIGVDVDNPIATDEEIADFTKFEESLV